MNNTPPINEQIETIQSWIDRLQHLQQAMSNPEQSGQEIVQSLLSDLEPDPVLGNIFRLRLDTGHAIRITLEMCVVVPDNVN